jgi:pimeloyl-ACP methyl ester carboxylesterase
MAMAISMPRLGMTMEEGTVVEWPVALGGAINKGDLILIFETEKAENEVESSTAGFLRHIYVEEGEVVPCGTLLAAITETADEPFDVDAFHATENHPDQDGDAGLQVAASPSSGIVDEAKPTARKPIAPAARAAAKKAGIDPELVSGTGPGGRITKQDVESYLSARESLVTIEEGVHLEVLIAGSGETVVLLPGLGTDVSAFARQTPFLADRFRVVGVNPRGVGLSDAPEVDVYEVARTALDAAATYEGAAHVIGASLGAAVAIELALSHPERVKSLTLITPFVEVSPCLAAIAQGWSRVSSEATPETLAASLLPWFFSSGFLADSAVRGRTLRGLAQTVAKVPAQTLARMAAGMEQWSGTRAEDLARLSVPTLVVAAGEDLLTQDANWVAEAIPGAKLMVVEAAGHAVALESADAVNAAIGEHLASLAST